jgi:class 3 adenylate cyclase/DNA-binding CsgD family transcriptional regulator/tetratricopeptide (TPR) repeat protein
VSQPVRIPSGTITLLFTDVEGSTKLWETEPELMAQALRRHDEILRAAIEQAGGFVFKTVGDAFCAAFATPQAALAAVLDAQQALCTERWPTSQAIRVRMGMHTGVSEERDNDYFGPVVNRTARLNAIAHGGQVLVSGATAELLSETLPESVSLRDLGLHRLKDLGRPEQIFQLEAEFLEPSFPPLRSLDEPERVLEMSRGRLVGRDAELGLLLGLLDAAAAGRPVVALVSGDAGVGKTRLVAELAAAARERGVAVLSGRCAELADTIPYLPLADALRDAATGASPGSPLLDALAARPVLSGLLPDRKDSQPVAGDVPGMAQQQLFGAVLGLLAELAAASPVVLILEDLHWADGSTRDLVTFLSRVVHRERLAIVVTYRTDDLHRRHPLRAVVAELLRLPSVTSVSLGPLDSSAMAEHLTSMSEQPLDAAALEQMITRAEGNAYYAEELLAASTAGCELPADLAELLVARMERLSATAQQVLRAAAVTGRRVDDELVMQASGLAAPEYEQAVREAVAHQLLVPDGTHGYAFRHALLREAIYADLLSGERTRLHARLAGLLSGERRLAEVAGSAAELAHHCLASHDIQGAFAASVMAGQEAERLAAPAEAHRHYDQALSLWERVSEPEKLAGVDRGSLAFSSAISAADSGDVGRAVHQLRWLLGFLGDADPALRCRAGAHLAELLMDIDEDDAALTAAQIAVEALPPDPPRWERARALATHASALLSMEDPQPARSRARQAQAAAKAARAPRVEADALVTLGLISERTGHLKDAIGLYARAHKQARGAELLGVELRAAFHLARVLLEMGDLAGAAAPAHEGTRRAQEAGVGLAPYGYDLQYLHYLTHYADGSWDHAQQIADTFTVRVTSVAEARLSAMALFVDVARGSAGVADRRAWLEPFFASDRFTEYIGRGLLAEYALWQGDADAAFAGAEATIVACRAWYDGYYGPHVIRPAAVGLSALADRARQARAADDEETTRTAMDSVRALVEIARAGAANRRRPEAQLGVEGRGWLARAEAEYRRADDDNDPAAWQAVVDAFGADFVYECARSRWRLAEALAEAGDRQAARREWLLAVQAADELEAAPLQAALAYLGRRARLGGATGPDRGEPTCSGSDGRGQPAALTARELEVLPLLTAGQSNKEIGAQLFIAAKTASVHVSNILAKLGTRSRTEAAAIAQREGLGQPARGNR